MLSCCILDAEYKVLYAGDAFLAAIAPDSKESQTDINRNPALINIANYINDSDKDADLADWQIGSNRYALRFERISNDTNPITIVGLSHRLTELNSTFLSEAERDGNIGAWSLSLEDDELQWSPKVFEIYGMDPTMPISVSRGIEQYSEESKTELEECLSMARDGVSFSRDFDFYNNQNQFKRVHVVGRPNFDSKGHVVSISGTIQDITQPYFEQLRNKLAFEAGSIGVFELGSDGYLHWNKQMADMYEFDDCTNLSYTDWANSLYDADKNESELKFSDSFSTTEPFEHNFRIVGKKSGRVKVIRAVARHYFDQNGRIERTVGINIDITAEQKRQQEDIFRKARDMQNSKFISLGEMAAGMGHEINNPLAILSGNLELLKEELQIPSQRSQELIGNIEHCINRIHHISTGLRRLVRDDTLENYHPINVVDVANTTVSLLKEIYAKQGIELTLTTPQELWAMAHFSELQQVLLNLLSNARDAVLVCDNKKIDVHTLSNEKEIEIRVIDTGVGISQEKQTLIFDTLYTEKPSGKGTGLGLGLCKRIISEHNGDISISSKVGEGTCVTVTLPKIDDAALSLIENSADRDTQSQMGKEPLNSSDVQQHRIVVVDDEPMILQILGAYLKKNGYPCLCTPDVKEALDALSTGLYTILITDVCMPDYSGPDLLDAVIAQKIAAKVIVMTGGILEKDVEEQYQELISAVLYKPFNEEKLMAEVQRCLT